MRTITTTDNFREASPAMWAPPPEGFTPVGRTRAHRIIADWEPEVEELRKPFRLVSPGVLIVGFEQRRRLTEKPPEHLRLEGSALGAALSCNAASATIGLVAGELHDVPREPGLLRREFDRMPTLYVVRGGMGGVPREGESPLSYCNHKTAVEGPELWAAVEGILAAGFTPVDLDVFASSPLVGSVALPACALEIVVAGQAAMSPRQLEALMKATAGRLKGWSKTDVSSPFALALFTDAVTDAIALATPSELPALVAKLLPRDSAAAAGGAE